MFIQVAVAWKIKSLKLPIFNCNIMSDQSYTGIKKLTRVNDKR